MTEEENECVACAQDYLDSIEELVQDCLELLNKAKRELRMLEDGQTKNDTGTSRVCERTDTDS